MKRSGVYSMNNNSYNPSGNSYAYSNLNRKSAGGHNPNSYNNNGGGDVEDGRIHETSRNIYEDENNERLKELGSQVNMMKQLALNIGQEVQHHNTLLGTMSDTFGQTDSLMGSSIHKIQTMLKKTSSSNMFFFTIFIVFIFIVIWFVIGKS